MEVKRGYKQTEVGVIPIEWGTVQVAELVTTGPKNGYSGRSGKEARGTPTLSLGATSSGSMVLNEGTVKRLDESIPQHSHLYLNPGDVLVQRSNTPDLVGTTAVFDGPAGTYVYPDLMMRMRFRADVTAQFFWRYANSTSGRRFFVSIAAGSSGSMPKISGEKLRKMPIPHPPLLEQRAIATALSDVDGLLGGLDRLIAKKRDLKQAAMQQLLTGQTRLPGFHGEWEVKRLPEISWFQEGPGLRDWQFTDAGMKVINVTNLENGVLNLERTDRHISLSEFNRMYQHFAVDAGDIVMASSGNSYNKAAVVRTQDLPLVMNTSVIRFKPAKGTNYGFLWALLTSPLFKSQIDLMITGGAQPNFGPYHLKRVDFPAPPLPEQTAIAEVLTEMDGELAALEQRREKTRALKQAMMQELLLGNIRLN
jgi:type I restriction enzyme S subunit